MSDESPNERDVQSLEEAENASRVNVVQELGEEVFDQIEAVLDIQEIKVQKKWGKGVQECKTREDFLKLFQEIGIPEGKWKSSYWLANKSKLLSEEGGIGKNLKSFYRAIQKRFSGYPKFLAWMEGKPEPEKTWVQQVGECNNPDDFLRLFREIGISGDKWKSSSWLDNKAKFPIEDGGIGQNLGGLYQAIKKRFQSHASFVAWMEGKAGPEKTWVQQVDACNNPDDFLRLFRELGICGDEWKNSNWVSKVAKLPLQDGGIERNLSGLCGVIRERFQGYPQFVGWMEGKFELEKSLVEKVEEYQSADDFLALFQELGIPVDKWKSCGWVQKIARLPPDKGGINQNLRSLHAAIQKRFPEYPEFVAWMEGKTEPDKTWVEKVEACKSPEDFLKLFQEAGIPEDKWKSSNWLTKTAKLSHLDGGIGQYLAGLYHAIQKRFQGHKKFVAWMVGSGIPEIHSPEEAKDFIQKEAERLKMRVDELLNPAEIGNLVKKSPVLKEALDYFAKPKS